MKEAPKIGKKLFSNSLVTKLQNSGDTDLKQSPSIATKSFETVPQELRQEMLLGMKDMVIHAMPEILREISQENPTRMAQEDFEKCVVRLTCNSQKQNFEKPQIVEKVQKISSSAFPVKFSMRYQWEEKPKTRHFLITNAHAVDGCKQQKNGRIEVEIYDWNGIKNLAHVVAIKRSCDIAIVQLDKPNEIIESKSIDFDPLINSEISNIDLPMTGESVKVMGFPFGYKNITVSSGRITSISSTPYQYYGEKGLTYTTDAVVNEGNSGGPYQDRNGNFGGIVFQGESQLTSYLIPKEVAGITVQHYISSAAEKTVPVHWLPRMSFDFGWQSNKENIKKTLSIANNIDVNKLRGIIVRNVSNSEHGKLSGLRKGDIITKIDSFDVNDEGLIRLREGTNIAFESLLMFKNPKNSSVNMSVIRDGKEIELKSNVYETNQKISTALCGLYKDYLNINGATIKYLEIKDLLPKNGVIELSAIPLMETASSNNTNDEGGRMMVISSHESETPIDPADLALYKNRRIVKVGGMKVNTMADILIMAHEAKKKNMTSLLLETDSGYLTAINLPETDSTDNSAPNNSETPLILDIPFYISDLNKFCKCKTFIQNNVAFVGAENGGQIICRGKNCGSVLCKYTLNKEDSTIHVDTDFDAIPIDEQRKLIGITEDSSEKIDSNGNCVSNKINSLVGNEFKPTRIAMKSFSTRAKKCASIATKSLESTPQPGESAPVDQKHERFGRLIFSSGQLASEDRVDGVDVETALS